MRRAESSSSARHARLWASTTNRAETGRVLCLLEGSLKMPITGMCQHHEPIESSLFDGPHEARAGTGAMLRKALLEQSFCAIANIGACVMVGLPQMDDVEHCGRPGWAAGGCEGRRPSALLGSG